MNSGNSLSSSGGSENRGSESDSAIGGARVTHGNVRCEPQDMGNEWAKEEDVNILGSSWHRGRAQSERNIIKSVLSDDADVSVYKTTEDKTSVSGSSPSVGLINEGCLCYLNSLLQLLFHLSYFRTAVYRMPDDYDDYDNNNNNNNNNGDDNGDKGTYSISQALKELFFSMQEGTRPVHTKKLTSAFGWSERDLYTQQDIQEMATLLRDNLEEKMKNTVTEGAINQLFGGIGEQVVVTIDKAHKSLRRDVFYDIHLPLSPRGTLIDSLRSLVAKEKLVGDNKYRVEEDGMEPQYKDAEKSYNFRRFPPVIWFHLKRFEMNLMSPLLEMRKVNSRLEFPLELDLREFEIRDCQGNEEEEEGEKEEKEGQQAEAEAEAEEAEETAEIKKGKEESDGQLKMKKEVKEENQEQEDEEEEEQKQKQNNKKQNNNNNNNKTNNNNNNNNNNNKYPFSTNSLPIYDLQGVIVHRGSVQSGHYYCYIREWDHSNQKFTNWFEFDDEKVTLVNEDVAVSNNFGGNMIRPGRQCGTMAIHNAYILSYVRRADCSKVLKPPPKDIISQRVKDVFNREKLENDLRQLEEQRQRQKLTLFIFTNDIIYEHVQRCQNKIFPLEMQECERIGIKLEVKKEDSLGSVYKAVASHKRLRALQLIPGEFCLWFSQSSQDCWPLEQFSLEKRGPETAMSTFLNERELHALNMRRCVYIQLATIPKPLPITAANWLIKKIEYNNKLNSFRGCVLLDPPAALHSIALDLETINVPAHIHVFVYIYYVNDKQNRLEHSFCLKNRQLFLLRIPENEKMQRVDYLIEVFQGTTGFVLNGFYLNALSNSLQKIKGKGYFHKVEFLKRGTSDVLVFFKYFNYVRCCVAYLGSALLPWTATIEDCGNIFCTLLGEDNKMMGSLQFFEERRTDTRSLKGNDSLNPNFYFSDSTCVLVVQRNGAVHLPSLGDFSSYIHTVFCAVLVRVAHIKFINSFSLHSFFFSPPNCGDVLSGEDITNNSSCCEAVECEYSSSVEVVSAYFSYEDGHDESFYPLRKFLTLKQFTCVMDRQWTYEEICEAIGAVSGHDPNFIRLYSNKLSLETHICPQPDPAPTCSFFDSLIGKEKNQVLFFETLKEPRRIVKTRPCVVVTICARDSRNLYTENIVMRHCTVYGELVRGSLERFSLALAKRRCFTCAAGANDVDYNITNDKTNSEVDGNNGGGGGIGGGNCYNNDDGGDVDFVRINSSHCKSNNSNDVSRSTAVRDGAGEFFDDITKNFTIGTHYVALVFDSNKIVREIIEVPLPSDGSCVCKSPVIFDEEPLTVLVVPAAPLKEGQYRMALCCGSCDSVPIVSGQPFVRTFNRTTTIATVREELLRHQAALQETDAADAVDAGLLVFSDTIMELRGWNDSLYKNLRAVANSKGAMPCTLMLNCGQPRAKPGLQGVALNSPALRIARK